MFSSGLWHHADLWLDTNVSEKHIVSIFNPEDEDVLPVCNCIAQAHDGELFVVRWASYIWTLHNPSYWQRH
jgi:hypothetical protein